MSSAKPNTSPPAFTQRDFWNEASGAWDRWARVFERGGASITEGLLEAAGVGPGQRVLDLGTGIGEPAFTAATRVGPAGRVVGADFARAMIEIAKKRASGIGNIEFLEGDIACLDLPLKSFDVILSRLCLMLLLDRNAALRRSAELLKPGGILAAAVWGQPETALLTTSSGTLSRLLDLPPLAPTAGQPGPFSLSDAGLCRMEMEAAGFVETEVNELVAPFWMDSIDEYTKFTLDNIPESLKQLLRERFGSEDSPELQQAMHKDLARCVTDFGILRLPSKVLIIKGRVP